MNEGITQTNETFNTILSGIFNRPKKITPRMDKKTQMKLDERYPGHDNNFYQSWLESKNISKSKINLDESGRFRIYQVHTAG